MNNEKMLLAKAWDNRIGCAIAIDVLKQLADEDHPNTVYGVATVQEEVGLRGARTSAHAIQPDIGFGVDVGIAGDTPGITSKEADSKLGDGPDRKSTRLNSSHVAISYAVFCLKKKK